MGLTETLCRDIAATSEEALTQADVRAALRLMLDGVSVAVAGSREEGPAILLDHLREVGGAGSSVAIGVGCRLPPVAAASLNGASMHVLDFEPMWSPPNHATSTTIPAVLALAESCSASGRDILTALVKGVEIQGRIRAASKPLEPKDITFHPPGAVGVMGAAVAAGHLLRLDGGQLRHALGIAASRAGSLLVNAGTMTKATHCGMAASLGMDAALLARRGFTANPDILDVEHGYAEVICGQRFDPSHFDGFGSGFRIVEPGYAVKLFPSQYGTHFGITAAIALHGRIASPGEIERVEITAPLMPYINRPAPETGLSGKFSYQYTVACGLLDGAVGIGSFADERRFRGDMEQFLPRILLIEDPAIVPDFALMHVEVALNMKDGQQLSERCDRPRSHWDSPPLSDEEHLLKVRDCLNMRLDGSIVEQVIAGTRGLDGMSPAEVPAWLTMLGNFTD